MSFIIEEFNEKFIIKENNGWFFPVNTKIEAETLLEKFEELEAKPLDLHKDFVDWDNFITELSEKEVELINLKELYAQQEQDILTNFDFKEAYGKNNETIRKNHVKNELKDIVEKKNDLEISITYLKRKIKFINSMVDMKIELISFGGGE